MVEYTQPPAIVVKYAERHGLKLEIEKYNIEKSDVKNGYKYKQIYPCTDKDNNIYAILYNNRWHIRKDKPTAVDIIYLECR